MTPEEEEQVRRALADLPAPGPMPAEVAERLDGVLADLVAGRSGGPAETDEPAPTDGPARVDEPRRVDELATRRATRRRWPRVLVAAAGLAVLAYGGGAVLTSLTNGGSGDAASESAVTADRPADSAAGGAAVEPTPPVEGAAPPRSAGDEAEGYALPGGEGPRLLVTDRLPVLDSGTLARDVRRLLNRTDATAEGGRGRDSSKAQSQLARCTLPATSRGDTIAAVRIDGRPATLVLHRPQGETRVAKVFSCGQGGRLLASTRLPSER